jgi:hypothetical protein
MMYSKDNDQVYVGFIVGPYTRKLNSWKVISEFTCFKVEDNCAAHYQVSKFTSQIP